MSLAKGVWLSMRIRCRGLCNTHSVKDAHLEQTPPTGCFATNCFQRLNSVHGSNTQQQARNQARVFVLKTTTKQFQNKRSSSGAVFQWRVDDYMKQLYHFPQQQSGYVWIIIIYSCINSSKLCQVVIVTHQDAQGIKWMGKMNYVEQCGMTWTCYAMCSSVRMMPIAIDHVMRYDPIQAIFSYAWSVCMPQCWCTAIKDDQAREYDATMISISTTFLL